MILAALVSLASAAPLPPYGYALPNTAQASDLDAYVITKWAVRTTLYAADTDTAVFDGPNGGRSTTLAFGDAVRVEEVGPLAQVGDRVDAWYRVSSVRSGWVFGGDLTPFRWEADMDGDGEKELVTAAWMSAFNVRVRVFEPNLRAGSKMQMDVESAGGAYVGQSGGQLTAELIPANEAGVALVHLHLGVEACADFRDDWISYTAPAATKIGTEHLALSLSGLVDPPNSSTYTVKFSGKRLTAYVTREVAQPAPEPDPALTTTPAPNETRTVSPPPKVTMSRYVLRDGVYYAEKDGAVERE